MPSPEEMRELAEAIAASKRSRREAIASLETEVKSQLAGYESDRQAMTRELHARLKADKAALMADTAALMKELAEVDVARQAEVKSQQAEVKSQLAGYRSDHQAMAEEVGAELAQARSQLETETASLMKELAEVDAARQAEVENQQAEVRSQLAGYRSEHQAMGKEVKAELAKATKARRQDVRSQLRGYGAEMKEVKAELVAVRTAWQQGLRAVPPKRKPRPPAPPTMRVREKAVRDDLTLIRGIGASMQGRLKRLGIVTYAQLAEASPAQIRTALGDVGRLAKVEEWIAQAKELAR